ncbi:MAG: nitroreductase family protein [Spirochaetes bacterium]|nr:nitroreductase family protein [Spirochaetota bacterium]
MIKKLLKLILPSSVITFIKSVKNSYEVKKNFEYDKKRYLKYSGTNSVHTKKQLEARIIAHYHVLEKGLSMPETKLGFGQDVVIALIRLLKKYQSNFGEYSLQCKAGLASLKAYINFHHENNFLIVQVENEAEDLIKFFSCESNFAGAKNIFKNDLIINANKSFKKFAFSRRSIRNYTEEDVALDLIYEAIQIAQKSPSVCNRQSSKVYIVHGRKKIDEVLSLQNGNRGFGHLANKLLIVTSDLQSFEGVNERNQAYIDSGLFSMSLLYAFHYKQLGACALNWAVEKDRDIALRNILSIPDSEVVAMMILLGHVPEVVKVACSPRYNLEEVVKVVK